MTDLRARLEAALGRSYVVEREIGGGAMGRVFLARDAQLGRHVVVKVVAAADGDMSVERFKREIQFAARLQHANIVPLLTAGDADGLPYYVMPFVDGESLRARLERGRLPIPEIVSILKDIARALQYAHGYGIVHRDVKPENVLMSGGAAAVSDFGIAKALRAARDEATSGTLTSAGTSMGTPAYMAPEQATGDPNTDHRADIYSFGCLAYELLAGEPPFTGTPPHRIIAAHLTDTPAPIVSRRADCPRSLASLVTRCLEKDPAHRPQLVREIVEHLDSVATPTSPVSHPLLAAASRVRIGITAAVALGAVAFVVLQRAPAPTPQVQALTVLPFVSIGGDSAQTYLGDGVAEEIATTLAKTRGVRVVGRSAANRFRGRRDVDVRAVGESLGVALVVQGSVRRTGDRMRVLAQLTDAATGEELWADAFEHSASQALAVRDEISRAILRTLRQRSGGSVVAPLELYGGSSNEEAYDLYLRGMYLLRRRSIPPAAEYFERAVARDPSFARAHASLSTALALLPYFARTSPAAVDEKLTAAARRAISLDSLLSEPHTALALARQHAMDWAGAAREHSIAVTLDPSDAEAHLQFGRYLLYVGLPDSAMAEFRRAQAIDPYSALYSAWIATTHWIRRREDSARAELSHAFELDSLQVVALQYGSLMLLQAGDTAGARRAVMRLPRFAPWSGSAAYVLGRLGDRRAVDSIRNELEATRPWFGSTALAYAAFGVGDTTAAFRAIERATASGEYWPAYFPISDRPYDAARRSARFRALVRAVGLDQRAITP